MMLESEAVVYLRADEELALLVPGGIYASSSLGNEGISDAIGTPDVWTDGEFQATVIVRQGAAIPTGQLMDFVLKINDANQRLSLWVYAQTEDEIAAITALLNVLLFGYRFTSAWPAAPAGGLPEIGQAPDLPMGIKVFRKDYMVRLLERAIYAT